MVTLARQTVGIGAVERWAILMTRPLARRLRPSEWSFGVSTMRSTSWLIGALVISACSTICNAHDIYTDLRKSNGQSCCDGTDCRPALFRWISIPQSAIMHRFLDGDTGETNGGHWCGSHAQYEDALFTHCVILPPDAASR